MNFTNPYVASLEFPPPAIGVEIIAQGIEGLGPRWRMPTRTGANAHPEEHARAPK
ncbi:hypothetical protein LEP1GSC017_1436 [Leptospira meyeri serovar Hardjo str. Went 5]|nr:hypothetical protein LEP1GSC017_1436 [Leptospira meyeri serovar Hardjo str. Went 5]